MVVQGDVSELNSIKS